METKKRITAEQALKRLTSLCSRSEQCEYDLSKKLISWRIKESDRNSILEYLRNNRYIDEKRFANNYALDKSQFSLWGPSRIRMELSRRKIKSEMIKEALEGVDPKIWKDSLLRLSNAKAKSLDLTGEESYKEGQKLLRYLIGRGFPMKSSLKALELMKKRQLEEKDIQNV